jgi:hypothetical protein
LQSATSSSSLKLAALDGPPEDVLVFLLVVEELAAFRFDDVGCLGFIVPVVAAALVAAAALVVVVVVDDDDVFVVVVIFLSSSLRGS